MYFVIEILFESILYNTAKSALKRKHFPRQTDKSAKGQKC